MQRAQGQPGRGRHSELCQFGLERPGRSSHVRGGCQLEALCKLTAHVQWQPDARRSATQRWHTAAPAMMARDSGAVEGAPCAQCSAGRRGPRQRSLKFLTHNAEQGCRCHARHAALQPCTGVGTARWTIAPPKPISSPQHMCTPPHTHSSPQVTTSCWCGTSRSTSRTRRQTRLAGRSWW